MQTSQPQFTLKKHSVMKVDKMPNVSKEICLEKARKFKIIEETDDFRHQDAYKDGGTPLNDQEVINKYRMALKMLIS